MYIIEKHIPIYTLLFIYNHIFYIYCYLHIIKDYYIICNTNYVFGVDTVCMLITSNILEFIYI